MSGKSYSFVMQMVNLNNRQHSILNCLVLNEQSSFSLSESLGLGQRTVLRELLELEGLGFVFRTGVGKNIKYQITGFGRFVFLPSAELIGDDRIEKINPKDFNFEIFEQLANFVIFDQSELLELEQLTNIYRSKTKSKKEFERLIIEFSWKSSKIEGNTYSLIETEELLKNHNEQKGHTKEETNIILNHKTAFDYILKDHLYYNELNKNKIIEIHRLLTANLNINPNIRKINVGITGSLYKPLGHSAVLEENLDKMCELLNKKPPFEKALLANLLISYLQPFEDANKRTSRLISNSILFSFDLPLISYRTTTVEEYKTAVLAFYEFNSLKLYKNIFLDQVRYFVANYF
jgi:predicted transcriptional regulator